MRIIGKSDLGEDARAASATTPHPGLEADVARLWWDLLGGGPVGRDDHFFERGGNSLDMMRLSARLEAQYGVTVPLSALFAAPTVAGMAAALRTAQTGNPGAVLGVVRRIAPDEDAPLSLTQERMWLLHQMDAGGTAYSVSGVGRVRGALSAEALEVSLRRAVERHETLRTTFVQVDGHLRQRVMAPEFTLERTDLRTWPAEAREAEAARQLRAGVARPFDFARGPMFRATLMQLADDEFLLLIDLPHLNSDAWSLGVLMDEVLQGYAAALAGEALDFPPLPVQYRDYALWQRGWLQGEVLEHLRAYWLPRLQNLTPLALPLDHPRPPTLTFDGAMEFWRVPESLLSHLRALALRENATLFMVMLTAFKVLLARWTGQDDIAVGTPVAGRHTPGVERVIGVFVNTLVLRTDLSGQPTFREALARVRDTAIGAFAHQDMPFAQLVADLQPPRDLSRSPLVSVMFNQINVPMPALELAGAQLSAVDFDRGGAQFDVTATVTELPGEERVTLEYNTALFGRSTMQALMRRFEEVLQAVAADPDQPLSALTALSAAEQEQVMSWSGDVTAAPTGTVHGRFEAQVQRTPDRPAIRSGGQTLTFGEVNAHANRVARALQTLGVQPGDVVGVCLPRSPEAVVAILAVLKAGGAYLPLDPQLPPARLGDVIADARPVAVVASPGWPVDVTLACPVLQVRLEAADDDPGNPEVAVHDDPLAYVMFTSGTTGRPKGVEGRHRGVLYRLEWMWEAYPFTEREVGCLKTSLGFVDSVWELFGPLLAGVPVVLVPDDLVRDPPAFVDLLARERVTRLVLVPSLLGVMLEALRAPSMPPLPELTLWSVSGEALNRDLAAQFLHQLPHATLLNLYGSTEVSGDATAQDVTVPGDHAVVAIGRPLPGAQCYVVDQALQLVPPGTPGELLVGGHGLARGYHLRPELTAERFIPNPFGAGRVYRTHDLVTWTPDGRLRWLGRTDRQLKIRGVRVEPEEIEVVLLRHPQVTRAVVVDQATPHGPELVAYVVTRAPVLEDEVRAYLEAHLPAAFVPSGVSILDALPLTPSGKVDRTQLPALPERRQADFRPPRTRQELQLAAMWADVLDIEVASIGLHDNFFELGGHSLLAATLAVRIEREFGIRLPLTALFQVPTIAALSTRLMAADTAEASMVVPFHTQGSRPPVFWLGHLTALWRVTRLLGPDQPVYGLIPLTEEERAALGTVERMADHYLPLIRELQPHGPYSLVGYSFGGLIVFEVARLLQAAGEKVRLVTLLDTRAPRPARVTPGMTIGAVVRHLRLEWTGALRQPRLYLSRARQRLDRVWARVWRPARAGPGQSPEAPGRAVPRATLQAAARYRANPQAVPIVLIRARERGLFESLYDWSDVAEGRYVVRTVEGDHTTMFQDAHLDQLGTILKEEVELAQDGSP